MPVVFPMAIQGQYTIAPRWHEKLTAKSAGLRSCKMYGSSPSPTKIVLTPASCQGENLKKFRAEYAGVTHDGTRDGQTIIETNQCAEENDGRCVLAVRVIRRLGVTNLFWFVRYRKLGDRKKDSRIGRRRERSTL